MRSQRVATRNPPCPRCCVSAKAAAAAELLHGEKRSERARELQANARLLRRVLAADRGVHAALRSQERVTRRRSRAQGLVLQRRARLRRSHVYRRALRRAGASVCRADRRARAIADATATVSGPGRWTGADATAALSRAAVGVSATTAAGVSATAACSAAALMCPQSPSRISSPRR